MTAAPAEATTEAAAASTEPQGTEPAAPETKPAEATTEPQDTAPKTVEDLPAWAQKIIGDARKDAGEERIASKTLAAIQKALDPDAKGDEKPDPAKLASQLTAQQNETRQARLDLAVYKAADKAGADTDLLDAVLARKGSLAELDPSDKDFTKKLDALVKAELDANPKLKAVQAATAIGSDFSGGSGEGSITQEKFDSMTPSEKNNLFKTNPARYRQLAGR